MLSFAGVPRGVPGPQPAPVHQHLHRARECRPGEQAHQRQHHRVGSSHLDPDVAADRVVGARVGVEPAGDHPDEEGRRGGVVHQAYQCARSQLRPEADPARVEPAQDRRGQRLRERHAEARRADDRDRLEHRGRAGAEAEAGTSALGHAGERDAAGERDPEAAGGSGAGREEGHDAHVRGARHLGRGEVRARRGGRHPATVAGAALTAPV